MNKEFGNILDVISGEKSLREKNEYIKKEKIKAVKEAKDKRRKGIVSGDIKIKKEDPTNKKVEQNVKVFEWSAPDRYPVKFNSKSFIILVAISLLFSLLLAILGKYLLMISILSLLFVLYIVGTTKPAIIKHKITKRGIDTFDKLYEWYMLDSFYFTKKEQGLYLIIETKLNFPRVIILLLDEKDKDPLFVLLQDKLLYKDIRKWGRLDRISYGEYIPLEKI